MTTAENSTPVRHVNNYLSDSRLLISFVLLLQVATIAGILLLASILYYKSPGQKEFILNDNNQIISPIPLNEEGITQAELNNWINDCAQIAFNFNYSNQQKSLLILREYMSEKSIESYKKYFKSDRLLSSIEKDKRILSMLALSAPRVINDGIIQNRYAWKISMDVQFNANNAKGNSKQTRTLEFLVWRVPETESDLRVKIVNFSMKAT